MGLTDWTETRKECEVDSIGNQTVKRVTLEKKRPTIAFGLEKKDLIDLSFRVVGLIAIFIPLWLFYKGQKAQREIEKTKFQVEVYTKASTLAHSLLGAEANDSAFLNRKASLDYELYPKILISNSFEVTQNFIRFQKEVEFVSKFQTFGQFYDTLANRLIVAYYKRKENENRHRNRQPVQIDPDEMTNVNNAKIAFSSQSFEVLKVMKENAGNEQKHPLYSLVMSLVDIDSTSGPICLLLARTWGVPFDSLSTDELPSSNVGNILALKEHRWSKEEAWSQFRKYYRTSLSQCMLRLDSSIIRSIAIFNQ